MVVAAQPWIEAEGPSTPMGRQKEVKRTANQAAWAELDAIDGGRGARLVVPAALLRHPNYTRMSYSAKAALWDIAADYDGANNGYLSAEWNKMRELGWGSEHTLRDAIAELTHFGWLFKTQVGGRDHRPNLYALTWRKLNRRAEQPLPIPSESDYARPLSTWKDERGLYVKPGRKSVDGEVKKLRVVA